MPILKNARWERLAQGVASGKSQSEAYRDAGFKSKQPHAEASRLIQHQPIIASRIAELLQQRAQHEAEVQRRLLANTTRTREWVVETAAEIVERCMQHRPVIDPDGNRVMIETPRGELACAYEFDAKGANGALQTIARVLGYMAPQQKKDDDPLAGLSRDDIKGILSGIEELRRRAKDSADAQVVTGEPVERADIAPASVH